MDTDIPAPPAINSEPVNGEWIVDPRGDAALAVRFYLNPVDNEEHIEIRTPGDERNIVDEVVDERYKRRFQRRWEAYKKGLSETDGQTRLETVNWIDAGNMTAMRRVGIATVEQLAGMSDAAINEADIVGLFSFREKAQQFVKDAEAMSEVDKLRAELEELKAQVAAKPRRGRQPKIEAAE